MFGSKAKGGICWMHVTQQNENVLNAIADAQSVRLGLLASQNIPECCMWLTCLLVSNNLEKGRKKI